MRCLHRILLAGFIPNATASGLSPDKLLVDYLKG